MNFEDLNLSWKETNARQIKMSIFLEQNKYNNVFFQTK